MPLNSLAPGYAKLFTDVVINAVTMTHVMTVPMNVVLPNLLDTTVRLKDGTIDEWSSVIDQLVLVLKALYNNAAGAATITHADMYSQADANSEPQFEGTYPILVAGTSANTTVFAGMATFSFKSVSGGNARVVPMETGAANNVHLPYASLGTAAQAFIDYLTGTISGWYARDNSYLGTFLFLTTKTNDPVRKRRLQL